MNLRRTKHKKLDRLRLNRKWDWWFDNFVTRTVASYKATHHFAEQLKK